MCVRITMTLAKLMLLIFPGVLAKFNVELTGNYDPVKSKLEVHYNGREQHVITNAEIETFKLSEYNLKNAVDLYFGKLPNDVFVRSPTPWEDLYNTYHWTQVTTVFEPVNARITNINSELQILAQRELQNNGPDPLPYNIDILESVENTISSFWRKNGELNVHQYIHHTFEIGFLNSEEHVSMSFTSTWGNSTEKKLDVVIGASSVKVTLEPGETVTAELQAIKATIDVEVEYNASLFGRVAANYNPMYKNHHFWSLEVNEVMSAANMAKKTKSIEVIKLGFYCKPKVVVRDMVDRHKMWEIPV